jgi:hypothetical protein
MRSFHPLAVLILLIFASCSARSQRGIADRRTDFRAFLPMKQDPYKDGLKPVKPHFKSANREQILRTIERACVGGKSGSSAYNPATQDGYYVNCNPRNRQLLNGYVPIDPSKEPRSHP